MLLISKDKKDLILNCNCGCDSGFHLTLDQIIKNDNIYAMGCFTNGNFYRDQNSFWETLKNKCRKIWAIITNKDYYYSDVVCTRDDLETLNQYIETFLEENPVVNNGEELK